MEVDCALARVIKVDNNINIELQVRSASMKMMKLLLRMVNGGKSPNFSFHGIVAFVTCLLFIHYGACVSHATDFSDNINEDIRNDTCSTEVCADAVTKISKSMNNSIDPCQNFYEFACGNFGREAQGLNDSAQVDQFSIILDRVQQKITNLIDTDIKSQGPRIFKLIKTYYRSCLNTTQIERRGLEPLRKILTRLGGWPVVLADAWTGQNFTWQQTDQVLQSLGYSPRYIFRIFVMKDAQNSSNNILYVGTSDTELTDIWHDEKILEAYEEYMIDVAVLLGADKNRAKVELDEALTFEKNLLYARTTASPKLEMIVDYVKIKDLQNIHAYGSWLGYLNNVRAHHFNQDDTVYIENPSYLYGVGDLLANSTNRVVANYMVWRAIADSVDYLSSEILEKRSSFDRIRSGVTKVQFRQKKCLEAMTNGNQGLLPGISAMYTKHFFKNSTKNKIAKMVTNVRAYYMDILRKSSEFSRNMTNIALRKNEVMKEVIGYPEELANIDFLEKYYEKMSIEPNEFFESTLKLRKFVYEKTFDRLMKSPNETFWIDVGVAADVQVFYHALYNAIVLPASILQYPFFDENQPNYLNYGSAGFLIGHEISHAFVFGEVPIDEYGVIRIWWTMEDQEKFRVKAQCFAAHYNNFTDGSDNSRIGRKTMNENIADNEGVKAAFNAYRTWKRSNGNEKRLNSLNYTNEQLFWISAASTLCTRKTEETKKILFFTDEHPSEELRINGVVSNSVEFGKAFECQIGTPMNPEQKCSFW